MIQFSEDRERGQEGDVPGEGSVSSVNTNSGHPSEDEGWQEPRRLEVRPGFLPVDGLPDWLADHIRSVAASTQTPRDLATILGYSALSAALGNKIEVQVRGGYKETANLYICAIQPSASRKSAVFSHMTGPISDHETALRQSGEDVQLIVQDATTEALAKAMADNGGSISLLCPEGDTFGIMAGLYTNGTASFGIYKHAWGGEPYTVNRIGREGMRIARPILTVGVTAQPSVMRELRNNKKFRGEGFLARFLWVWPTNRIGHRKTGYDVPALDESAASRYAETLTRLLSSSPPGPGPFQLRFSDEALNRLFQFEAVVEALNSEGGALHEIQDWGGKLFGQTVRLAALVEVAWRAEEGGGTLWHRDIRLQSVELAIATARELIPHAQRAFDAARIDPTLSLARYVWSRVRGTPTLTVREVQRLCSGKTGMDSAEDVRRILSVLADHNLVRLERREPGPNGGSPSEVVHTHPRFHADDTDRTSADLAVEETVASERRLSGPNRAGGAE